MPRAFNLWSADFVKLFFVAPEILVEPCEPQLEQTLVPFADLGWNCPTRRDDIAHSEKGKDETETRNLPRGIGPKREVKESIGVVQLEEITHVEEWQQKTQPWNTT